MHKRSYGQLCGLAKTLDVMGGRWSLLIVRNLLLGPLRYSELLNGLPGITTNLLAERLRDLDAAGVIESRDGAYQLTDRGRQIEPAIHALGKWGEAYLEKPAPGDVGMPDWGLVALKRRYRGVTTRMLVNLVIDGREFLLVLGPDRVDVRRGSIDQADVTIHGRWRAFIRLIYKGESAAKLVRSNQLSVAGKATALRRFLRSFSLSQD